MLLHVNEAELHSLSFQWRSLHNKKEGAIIQDKELHYFHFCWHRDVDLIQDHLYVNLTKIISRRVDNNQYVYLLVIGS